MGRKQESAFESESVTLSKALNSKAENLVVLRVALADLELVRSAGTYTAPSAGSSPVSLLKSSVKVSILPSRMAWANVTMPSEEKGASLSFLNRAVGGAGHAHRVEDLVVLFVGDLLIATPCCPWPGCRTR